MRSRSLFAAFLLLAATAPLHAAVTGTVITRDGKAVSGAKISLLPVETLDARNARLLSKTPTRTPLLAGESDSKGNFSLDGKEAVMDLRVDVPGYAPQTVRVARDEDAGVLAVAAAPVKSGTITANGKPLAGATVIWFGGSGELVATTDAQGHYSAPDPAKWANRALVIHPDYAALDDVPRGPVLATRGAGRTLDRTLDSGVALKGRVVAADGTTPVAKSTILVDGWPLATTADDGTFSIAHAPKSWQALEAQTGSSLALRTHISITKAGEALTLKLAATPSVSGSMRDAKSQLALAGAEVRLLGEGRAMRRAAPFASAFTDAKGNYAIGSVAPGSYRISVVRPGYASPNSPAVSLGAGAHITRALAATAQGHVSGTVLDEQKNAVSAAVLTERNVDRRRGGGPRMMMAGGGNFGGSETFSGPDGRFAIFTEPDTDVQVQASKTGFPSGNSSTLHIASAEKKTGVVVTIPRGVAVTGHVVDGSGKPISGVAVTAGEASDPRFGGRFMRMMGQADTSEPLRTGSDGSFSMRLKEGSYDLNFQREGFAPKSVRAQRVDANSKPISVTMTPGVSISGHIVRGGAGVDAVFVTILGQAGEASAITGSDGAFQLADLAPGVKTVMINKPDGFIQQTRNVTAPAHDVVFEIPPGGRVSGKVVDKSSNQPITTFNAGVSASRSGGGFVIAVPTELHEFTTDDGSFVLDNVPAGPVQLVVSAAGYTTAHVPGLTLEEGKSLDNVAVSLDTGVRVTGHVTSSTGSPVSGASVRLESGGGGRGMRGGGGPPDASTFATTDANGEFELDAVEAGQQTFDFSANGLLSDSKTVNLTGKDAQVDMQLSSGIHATGQVVTDAGAPVPDATVHASSAANGGATLSTTSDASGSFQFDGLAPGHYEMTAAKGGYTQGILRDFDISSGAPARITLGTGGSITGHVTGLSDADMAQASVRVRGTDSSSIAPVDAGGNFHFDVAPIGTLQIYAEVAGGITDRKTSATKTIQLDAGGTAQVDLEFKTDTVIRGRITRNGAPLPGVLIGFTPQRGSVQTSAHTSADENGSYSVTGLEDGNYSISVVDLQRQAPFSAQYTVQGSATYDIDLKTGSLHGHVIDATTSEPVADATVQIRPASGDMSTFRTVNTDASGAFVVDSVPSGTYHTSATKTGYGTELLDVVASDSSSDDIAFKLAPNDGVTLKIVDARDGRTISGWATVMDAQGRMIPQNFSMGGSDSMHLSLSPGAYTVTISAEGYASQHMSITSPGQQTVGLTPGGTLLIHSQAPTVRAGRLVDANGQIYSSRGGSFNLYASPGTVTLPNVSPGTYTVQALDANGQVTASQQVVVVEGQIAETTL